MLSWCAAEPKSAAGLANAVLHKVADNVGDFATASDVDESERRLVRLSPDGSTALAVARIMASFGLPEGALTLPAIRPPHWLLHENAFATKIPIIISAARRT